MMVRKDIGSLVVLDGTRLAGMLTFREVLNALEAHQGSLSGLKVEDLMLGIPSAGVPRTRWRACARS
jgi:CBS domain-containing protein